jgi:pyruvyltransferase
MQGYRQGDEKDSLPVSNGLFWINSNNFGDALNPVLHEMMTGHRPETPAQSPKTLAIGSIVHLAGPGDTVWGTGCMSTEHPISCDETTKVHATRGPLTASMLRAHGVDVPDVYGDPAILLPRYVDVERDEKYSIGLFPHYVDAGKRISVPSGCVRLKPMALVMKTIKTVLQCAMIVSSSLHGLVVAEAFGIPAVWIELSDGVAGHGFKFADYYLGTGRQVPQPLDWRSKQNWRAVRETAKKWRPPECDLDELLERCPFQ